MANISLIINNVGLVLISISLLCTFITTIWSFVTLRRRNDPARSYVSWVKASSTLAFLWLAFWIAAMTSPVETGIGARFNGPRFHVYAVYQLFYLVTLAVLVVTQVEVARAFEDASSGRFKQKKNLILLGVFVALSVIRFILYQVANVSYIWVAVAAYAIDLIQFLLLWVGSIVALVWLVRRKGQIDHMSHDSRRVYKMLMAIFILTLLRQTFEGLYAIAYFISLFISSYVIHADIWMTVLYIPRVIFTACTVAATLALLLCLSLLPERRLTRTKFDGEAM